MPAKLDAVVYDLEIVRAVPQPDEPRFDDVEYCAGWHDKAGMGIACLCAKDLYTGASFVFLEDNLDEFFELVAQRKHLIGFNSLRFDDLVVEAVTGTKVTTTYDLKHEALGIIGGRRVPGRSLDDYCRVNLGLSKPISEHFMLPIWWQRGRRGTVINECLSDVELLARLVHKLPEIIDPVTGRTFTLRPLDDSTQFDLGVGASPARLSGDRHGE